MNKAMRAALLVLLAAVTALPATAFGASFAGEVVPTNTLCAADNSCLGSYATQAPSSYPAGWNIDTAHGQQPFPVPQSTIYSNVTGKAGSAWKPTPTSDWWTSANWDPFGERQYADPLALWARPGGLQIFYHAPDMGIAPRPQDPGNPYVYPEQFTYGADMQDDGNDFILGHSAQGSFPSALTDGFSDWFVTRKFASGGSSMTVSYGHGSPFVYATYAGGNPKLTFKAAPKIFSGTASGSVLGINANGRYYGLFGPTGSTWSGLGTTVLTNNLPAGKTYFSLALLPDGIKDDAAAAAALNELKTYAYSFVTNTTASYTYNAPDSYGQKTNAVVTRFAYTIQPMEAGAPNATAMALYPHQWRYLDAAGSGLPTGESYQSTVGAMKLAFGNAFTTVQSLPGSLPSLPNKASYDPAQLKQYLQAESASLFADKPNAGSIDPVNVGTYYAGKELGRLAALIPIAEQVDPASATNATNLLRNYLGTWLKASNADGTQRNNRFFAYDKNWGSLIGYKEEFWSGPNVTDHHFHYGYYIKAAAELARKDKTWMKQYGGMVNTLIREIAAWDRNDSMFPYLREFDPYAGHSWADGKSMMAAGNDQESVSEAINAWAGILEWGQEWGDATGDYTIRDLGAYLYTTEITASNEYWFDVNDTNHPADWKPAAYTLIFGGHAENNTFWTLNPELQGTILWLPFTGASLYLGQYPDYVQKSWNWYQSQVPLYKQWNDKEYTLDKNVAGSLYEQQEHWPDLNNMYLALANPAQALSNLNGLIQISPGGSFPVEEGNSRSNAYFWIQNLNALGQVDRTVSADYPFAVAFNKAGVKTYVVYNMGTSPLTVNFSDGQRVTVSGQGYNTSNGTHIQDTVAPTAPTGVQATKTGSKSVWLKWTPSADNRAVTGYVVYANGSQVAASASANVQVTGLSPSTSYSFTVKAKDADGNLSPASGALPVATTAVDTQAPAVPTGVAKTAATESSIDLVWNPSSDNIKTTDYEVWRGGVYLATVQSTSYRDSGLTPLTYYSYQVRAVDADGNASALSAGVNLRTGFKSGKGFKQNITEQNGSAQALFEYAPTSGQQTVILHYGINADPSQNPLMTLTASGAYQATVSGLKAGDTLYYYYTAVSTNGVGSDSEHFEYKMGTASGPAVGAPPAIASISPASGAPGASVTIAGSGFGSAQGASTVSFGGAPAAVTGWTDTSIAATVPAGVTAGSVGVTVTTAAGTSNASSFTVTANAPALTGLSPNAGLAGSSVTITGTGFGAAQGASIVKFGSTVAAVTGWSAASITATVPSLASGSYSVSVTTAAGASNTLTYTVSAPAAAPVLTAISPSSGAPGAIVTLTGSHFGAAQGSSSVKFGATAATVTSWSDTSITAAVPNLAAGSSPVTVTTSAGTSASVAFTVTSGSGTGGNGGSGNGDFSQSAAAAGASSVKITFTPTTASDIVILHYQAATVAGGAQQNVPMAKNGSVWEYTINGVSAGSTISYTFTYTKNGIQQPESQSFQYPDGSGGSGGTGGSGSVSPAIASLSPSSGKAGTSVTIAGSGFGDSQGASTVKFGGTTAAVSSWSDTSVTVTVPGIAAGNVGVTVVTSAGASGASSFTVLPSTPTLSAVSPSSAAVGSQVTLTGSGFGASQSTSTVKFGTAAATVGSWSDTSISVTVPASLTAGTAYSVTVTTAAGASNGMNFTVAAASGSGSQGFSQTAVKTGANALKISFTPASPSTIAILHFTTPAIASGGQQNVNMANNNGTWEYTITGVQPGNETTYWFTYTKDGLQQPDTQNFKITF